MIIFFLFLIPFAVWNLTKKIKLIKKIGSITICYILGFIVALLPIKYDKALVQTVTSIIVAISIPLMLFSFDLHQVRILSRKTITSFILLIISVIAISSFGAVIASSAGFKFAPQFAGMATGLYIGGTPNLFAIGSSLLDDINIINAANISDTLFGSLFFLLIISVLKNIYKKSLGDNKDIAAEEKTEQTIEINTKNEVFKLLCTILLAVTCLGIGAAIEILVNGNLDGSLYIMITVSVLGIAFSLIKPIREIKSSFQFSQFLILVFSFGLGISVDFSSLTKDILPTLVYFSGVQVFSMILHFLLCKIFRIDGGTALITGVAGIYGPPFIAPVANAYGDTNLTVSGIICGSFGLVIGNIIGIAVGSILTIII